MTQVRKTVRWAAGLVAAAVLVYMSYLSMLEGFTLQTHVILGMLAVIVLLMYGVTELVELVEAYNDRR